MRLALLALLLLPSLSFAGAHKTFVVVRGVDESVTNSDVYQDDDHLIFGGIPGATYYFTMDLHFESASAVPDVKFKFIESVAGSTVNAHCSGQEAPSSATFAELHQFGQEIVLAISEGTEAILKCSGILEVEVSAMDVFGVQWAQNTANATPTIMHSDSHFTITRFTR